MMPSFRDRRRSTLIVAGNRPSPKTRLAFKCRRMPLFAATVVSVELLSCSSVLALCTPPAGAGSPPSGTLVACTGVTNNQNNPNGYGDGTQNGLTINVQSGATVQGQRGLFLGESNTIVNSGLIAGVPGAGIVAASATINNSGTISSTTGTAVIVSTTIFAPSAIPTVNYLTNFASGVIVGQGDAVHVGDGIQAGTATIYNLGSITGVQGHGVIISAGTNVSVINSATISGVTASLLGELARFSIPEH